MFRTLTLVAAVLVAAAAALAGASTIKTRTFTASAPVQALAADGSSTAFAVGAQGRDCRHVDIWNRSSRAVVRLGSPKPCPPATSTGSGLVGPSLAGPRAAWLTFVGGNIREWSLWTATATARTPKQLRFVARDVDAAAPIVLGEADSSKLGFLLPYTIDSNLYLLQADGRSTLLMHAPSRIVAVAAKAGELAAALESGPVVILEGSGQVLRTEAFASPVSAVRITGNALVAQQGRVLALRNGTAARNWTLPAGSTLADAEGTIAVYVRANELHLFSLVNGKDVVFRRTSTPPAAQLEPAGLVYSVAKQITFVPTAELVARLR